MRYRRASLPIERAVSRLYRVLCSQYSPINAISCAVTSCNQDARADAQTNIFFVKYSYASTVLYLVVLYFDIGTWDTLTNPANASEFTFDFDGRANSSNFFSIQILDTI